MTTKILHMVGSHPRPRKHQGEDRNSAETPQPMQTTDEYFKKIQDIISNSKIVASTNIEYIKVLEV